jgi:HopA1 effector protein family
VRRYRDQIAAAAQAVTIRGPTRYAWLGRASPRLPPSLNVCLEMPEQRRYLVSSLVEQLYQSFYSQGAVVPARWGRRELPRADDRLVVALSEANTGRGSWQSGWTALRLEGDEAVVATRHLRTRVARRDCRAHAGFVGPGARVSLRLPKQLPAFSPGYCTVLGDAPLDDERTTSAVRVYWNVTSTGAPSLVRALTSWLNAEAIPFRLKVIDHPSRFARCDTAVLYLPSDTFRALRKRLGAIAAALTTGLRPSIPAFTLELAPGVGLAEDDGAGASFGVQRCALLAECIVRTHEAGISQPEARIDAIAGQFEEAGVKIDAPYLSPLLADRHVL